MSLSRAGPWGEVGKLADHGRVEGVEERVTVGHGGGGGRRPGREGGTNDEEVVVGVDPLGVEGLLLHGRRPLHAGGTDGGLTKGARVAAEGCRKRWGVGGGRCGAESGKLRGRFGISGTYSAQHVHDSSRDEKHRGGQLHKVIGKARGKRGRGGTRKRSDFVFGGEHGSCMGIRVVIKCHKRYVITGYESHRPAFS